MIFMTLQAKLKAIGDAYAAVVPRSYHYWRPGMSAPFLVWAEDGGNQYYSDNQVSEQAITGSTDYFTKMEYDPVIDDIQKANASMGLAWRLNSVQFEEDTGLIHYEWAWEVR